MRSAAPQDGSPVAQRGRNDSGQEWRTDVARAPQAEFRQGLGREATEARSAPPNETRIYRAFLPPVPFAADRLQVEAP